MEKLQFKAQCSQTRSTTTIQGGETHRAEFTPIPEPGGGWLVPAGDVRPLGLFILVGDIKGEFTPGRDYVFTAKELP